MSGPWIKVTTRSTGRGPGEAMVNMANASRVVSDEHGAQIYFLGVSAYQDSSLAFDMLEVSETTDEIMKRVEQAEKRPQKSSRLQSL